MYPNNQRKRSARLRGKSSSMWGAVPMGSSGKDNMRNYTAKDDRNVGVETMSPVRVSERIRKRREIDGDSQVANADRLAAVRTEVSRTGCVQPKNRGRRSVRRPRGDIPASWGSTFDEFQSYEVEEVNKLEKNVQEVVSKKVEFGQGEDTTSTCNASENAAKVEKIEVNMVDTVADLKENIGADISGSSGAALASNSSEVNGPYANGTDHISESAIPDASVKVKLSNGAGAHFAVQAAAPTTSILADLKEINGETGYAPVQSAVQMTDVVDPQQRTANDTELDSKKSSCLDLGNGDCSFDISSAESALASLYGPYDKEGYIEFAVKLLMNEIPLPKEAAEVEEFFRQAMKPTRF